MGSSPRTKTITLLLCIFLGYLGIHRFYVGKMGTGILYLCTGGLFTIGYIVDCVMILIGSFKDKEGLTVDQW
jgi:TM2 domain-containing membrane protein YozV